MFETKKKKIKLTKFLFWKGCIADFFAAIFLSYEALTGTGVFIAVENSLAYKYSMGFAATLMWGWTLLLYWGTRKPIERSALLIITAVPVILGLILNVMIYTFNALIPLWIILIFIFSAYLYGFYKTRDLRK
ncbi:hypothetical protein NEF87_002298 [Candidatus Lokiarchaeum ossiferum]|uniref:DUF3054 domain-containing protein n=1 Tax=Candidatus Lokiarchaeum ossiferum TaxID=2951803 RepID=A0ABY6HR83_9ARCH|nr:hypothetical protein NEF87_002298 [Candidatus Lokiarchaeum sp. B-35]